MDQYSVYSSRSSTSGTSIQRLIAANRLDAQAQTSGRLQIHCKADNDIYIIQTPGGFKEVHKDALQHSLAGEVLLLHFDFWHTIIPFLTRRTRSKHNDAAASWAHASAPEPSSTRSSFSSDTHNPAIRIVAEGPRNDYFCWEEDKVRYFLVHIGDTTFQSSHHNLLKTWPGRVLLYEWPAYNEGVASHLWRDVKRPLARLDKKIRRGLRRHGDLACRRERVLPGEDERHSVSFDSIFRRPSLSGFRSPVFFKRPAMTRLESFGSGMTTDSELYK